MTAANAISAFAAVENMDMASIYEADLSNYFHKVTSLGAASERASVLMRWFGAERQSSGFWSDVHAQFQSALEPAEREDGWKVAVIQNDGFITLICLDPDNAEAKDRWCLPVRELAEKPAPGRRKQSVLTK